MQSVKFLLLLVSINTIAASGPGVTYTFSGGRFGDNLLAYIHAKWISYKFGMPLIYKPFWCSNKLALHNKELLYDREIHNYRAILAINKDLKFFKNLNILYDVPYFTESEFEITYLNYPKYFDIDWKDKNFIALLKKHICPIIPFTKINIPMNHISIAVHVRKGSGTDINEMNELLTRMPLKFPPDSYYIQAIKKITEVLPNISIYICIFTDYIKPQEMAELYKKEVNNPNIIFDYRTKNNYDEADIIDDFFGLTQLDCLIRPDSNFSLIAEKITDYRIVISPSKAIMQNGKATIESTIKYSQQSNQ